VLRLAAHGQSILADKIAGRFLVDESGRIFSDFRDYPEMVKFIHGIAKGAQYATFSLRVHALRTRDHREKAATVFDVNPVNAYACRFMTITCDVKPEWRKRIAAMVHVDGSVRPQTIKRETNPLYYDILNAFERESGLPVLVNTSFNVHEEPIVNKPPDFIRALLDVRIDFVATAQGIYERASSSYDPQP